MVEEDWKTLKCCSHPTESKHFEKMYRCWCAHRHQSEWVASLLWSAVVVVDVTHSSYLCSHWQGLQQVGLRPLSTFPTAATWTRCPVKWGAVSPECGNGGASKSESHYTVHTHCTGVGARFGLISYWFLKPLCVCAVCMFPPISPAVFLELCTTTH